MPTWRSLITVAFNTGNHDCSDPQFELKPIKCSAGSWMGTKAILCLDVS
jgi:hypothetical protein